MGNDRIAASYQQKTLYALMAFIFRGLGDTPIMARFDLLDIAP